jgi:hypothetical protein
MASLASGTLAAGEGLLSQSTLKPFVKQVLPGFSQAGLPSALVAKLASVNYVLADLPGGQLGAASRRTIYLDRDAAGHGWFIDSTPAINEEYRSVGGQLRAMDARAVDRIDLLTVVAHELGHIAGLDDVAATGHNLMSGRLPPGVRRLPGAAELQAARGRLFDSLGGLMLRE